MADIKWIKITTDMFSNRKIEQIEAMPDGDTIIVIWVKLLTLAGQINDCGAIYLTKDIAYTDEMLATAFKRPITTVRLALKVFQQFGMIQIVDDVMQITNWQEYQNVEGMERVREQTRNRVAKHRERKRLMIENTRVTDDVTLHNVTVTEQNKNKKENKSKKENINNTSKEVYVEQNSTHTSECKEIIAYLNEKAGKNFKPNTRATQRLISARLNEGFTVDDFKTVIDNKVAEWKGDAKMDQYLQPSTLFAPSHFDGYLNQKAAKPSTGSYDYERLNDEMEGW
jgi:predicted phage replisome organizer/uncharacterized phage protein (TIGR02220 family)